MREINYYLLSVIIGVLSLLAAACAPVPLADTSIEPPPKMAPEITAAPAPAPASLPEPAKSAASIPEDTTPIKETNGDENRSPKTTSETDELIKGSMIDAHAHFRSKSVNIDELMTFVAQADIGKVVLFAGAAELRDAGRKYPNRIIPFLSPFKRDPSTRKMTIPRDSPKAIESQLESGFFRGIGEITLRLHPLPVVAPQGDNYPADSPVMLEIYDLVAKYGVPINVHVDPGYSDELERALEHNRKAVIIWAHCGYASPSIIRKMMDKHPNLYGDLSIILDPSKPKYVSTSISPDGSLSREWKDLLENYSERLMFGTDMGMSRERYEMTAKVTEHYRNLLEQLSPEAAGNIAYRTMLHILEAAAETTVKETQQKSPVVSQNVSPLADSPWAMLHKDARHTGVSPYDTSHVNGTVKWSFETGAGIESSPVIGKDRTIYVGSHDGKLYAINPDGTKKWRFTGARGSGIISSPAIGADGTIYFGSWNKKLYAVGE
ncbi:PQQ-binding-like beta-propeller repeat protein [Chloroflexota bacterium]